MFSSTWSESPFAVRVEAFFVFFVSFLPSSPAFHPTLPLFQSRWLNFYSSFSLTFFLLLFSVLFAVLVTWVWQSKMSWSGVNPFLFGAESYLSCRNLHVYIQEMYFYLQDDIVSNNFINRINFSGIFSFKCDFKMLNAFLYMMHSMATFFLIITHLWMHCVNQVR